MRRCGCDRSLYAGSPKGDPDLALRQGCTAAILKSRSPSCGAGQVYDGSFSGVLRSGQGLWARLLLEKELRLFSEEALPPLGV